MTAFDYVIAGGGTAGCVLAARLSERPDTTVCLLEAGPSDAGDEAVLRLADWYRLLESGYDWDYPVEPQPRGNSFLRHARARVLGGCSSHNTAIAFWAPAEDLDGWAVPGWTAEDIFPLYRQLESNDAPGGHHGRTGPVRITTVPPRDPCGVALLQACAGAGIPTVEFNAGHTVRNGAGWFQLNAHPDGTRSSASAAYLHPALHRPNLDLRTGVRVKRVTLDGYRATGVEYQTPDRLHAETVMARREVILAAGAIDTPKLLMLSGIGPVRHLRDVGVEPLLDAPGVGQNLQDHPEGLVQWHARAPMVTETFQGWEIGIFATTDPAADRPDLMLHYGQVPFDLHTVRAGYPTSENAFCLTPNVTRARSRGTVRLASCDFRDKPRVDPRYFTDDYDMRVMVAGLRLARRIVDQPAMAGWAGAELAPGRDARSDDELADYVRATHNTVYHPSCTVAMGEGPNAPLDTRLRVKGVHGLRVADASVMPSLVTVNPCITTMAIGQRCADLLVGASPGSSR